MRAMLCKFVSRKLLALLVTLCALSGLAWAGKGAIDGWMIVSAFGVYCGARGYVDGKTAPK
jgi:hypothetical protein